MCLSFRGHGGERCDIVSLPGQKGWGDRCGVGLVLFRACLPYSGPGAWEPTAGCTAGTAAVVKVCGFNQSKREGEPWPRGGNE